MNNGNSTKESKRNVKTLKHFNINKKCHWCTDLSVCWVKQGEN